MASNLYAAFVNAGLEKEAKSMSNEKGPGLGHYITVFESIPSEERLNEMDERHRSNHLELYGEAIAKVDQAIRNNVPEYKNATFFEVHKTISSFIDKYSLKIK